ncbi:MAG: DUF1844 domain-containing protein [Candidatus Omnitrophica bacterium]|nr:DUF1844 domain-containing protein [Candidatus Omnitrophota bacterium]MBU1047065.1 DUF1844 domain-containing protein [Candidatus Omnitrophota bacterium]MBU1630548.1 DUF1844 domain-containing protein [Candidatus Omnitrophota bacterium]MBU1767412.1 DUF1844 domain-containing protein [Candidatus Omnitrophota bacterium]MBU1888732.1 DUF1844 domain-containing protein [Candidatus Omnitrophota bacterium]
MEEKERMEIHFMQFISSLYSSCMFQLGKIMNPITGKVEKDLAGARATIELLRMIEAKTEGNLSAKEKSSLADALANMQMNYVDEVKKGQEKKPEAETKDKEENKEQKTETKKAEEGKKTEEKKPSDGKNSKRRIIVP